MFDISWGKLVIIGVVALLVIGPKELPAVLRQVGQWMTKIRRMAAEFQGQFQEAMREAEMADLKKQFDETTSSLNSALDPAGFKTDMEKLIQDPLAMDSMGATSTPPSDPAAPMTPAATEATSDPAAPGTGATPAADISVPMPDLPPPPESQDFAEAAPSTAPAPKPEGDKAA